MSSTASHTDRLVAFLKKDIGGAGLSNEQIREFSKQLKELDIIDMSVSANAEWLITNGTGQQVLVQLVSWYTLGLLANINNIKKTIKEK